MELKQLTYLVLTIVFALSPLFTGIYKKVSLRGKLKYIFPAILFSCAIFIIWDKRFTEIGIWTFNPEFVTGINFWKLPVEEWLFLLFVSQTSFVVYEWVKIKFPNFEKPNIFLAISLVLLVIFGLTAYFYRKELYPFFTFFLLSVYFAYTIFRNRFKRHFTKFYITYIVVLIPVFMVKEILILLPVISYNISGIMRVHIFNVPAEDLGYYFLLILMNLTIFEYLNERRFY